MGGFLCVALRISACDKFKRVENVENVERGAVGRPTVGAAVPAARTVLAVENVEIVENKLRGATKVPLTFRLNAPRVPLTNTGEQVFREPASRSGCRGGRQGTAAPTIGLGARRTAGDCRPYHGVGGGAGGRGLPPLPWVGGGACEACGETLVSLCRPSEFINRV